MPLNATLIKPPNGKLSLAISSLPALCTACASAFHQIIDDGLMSVFVDDDAPELTQITSMPAISTISML